MWVPEHSMSRLDRKRLHARNVFLELLPFQLSRIEIGWAGDRPLDTCSKGRRSIAVALGKIGLLLE